MDRKFFIISFFFLFWNVFVIYSIFYGMFKKRLEDIGFDTIFWITSCHILFSNGSNPYRIHLTKTVETGLHSDPFGLISRC